MENISFNVQQEKYINEKLDVVLHELQNFRKKLEENFIKINKKIDETDKKVTNIDNFNTIEHKHIMENIERLDRRITKIQLENIEEHRKTQKLLNSINSAFIKYETERLDKLRILFDADVDRKHHQDIYAHEFAKLNDLVAKNSYRISNLEQHLN